MPTDESYLDALLKGMSSDSSEDNSNRLSVYGKKKKNDQEPVLEESLAEEVTEVEEEVVDEISYTDEVDEEIDFSTDDELGDIQEYNLFDDYDEKVIDRMIEEELSGGETSGEHFVMPENNYEDLDEDIIDYTGEGIDEEAQDDSEVQDALSNVFSQFEEDDSAYEETQEEPQEEPDDKAALDDLLAEVAGDGLTTTEDSGVSSDDLLESGAGIDIPLEESEDSGIELPQDDMGIELPQDDMGIELPQDDIGIMLPEEDAIPVGEDSSDNSEEGVSSQYESNESVLEKLGGMGVLDEGELNSFDEILEEIDIDGEQEEHKKDKDDKPKEKLPWYLFLFANQKIPEDKIKPEPSEEELAAKAAAKAEAKKAAAAEKKAAAAEKKKAAAEAKAAKAKQTAEEKAAAKAKKLEQAQLILEETDNTTRINIFGAIIILVVFLAIAALIVSSGSLLTYNARIKQANKSFTNALKYQDVYYYSEAYDEIYGLELKDDDVELGDKIYTVNFVQKQVTSFYTHYSMHDYASALNDLYKGLLRYNKWIAHGYELGIEDDLYFVRSVIYALLQEVYGISPEASSIVLDEYSRLYEEEGSNAASIFYTKYIYEVISDFDFTAME